MAHAQHDYRNDENIGREFLRNDAIIGNMTSRCQEYLDERTYRNTIHMDSGEYVDVLELYAPTGLQTIQKIIDDQQEYDAIRLQSPAPDILAMNFLKISDDPNSYIIPSEKLTIETILPRSGGYRLSAILCEINQHIVVFIKHFSTKRWYFYQNDYTCESLNENVCENFNRILDSRSLHEQKRLIESTHFLISMIFHNAVKYIYIPDD